MESNSLTNTVLNEKAEAKEMSEVTHKSLFIKSTIHTTLFIPFGAIGSNIKEVIENELKDRYEGKCIREGFVRPGTIKVLQYSSGVCRGNEIVFEIVYQAFICFPVEGTRITIEITNITKAGIRGKSRDALSPIDVFVARDHHINESEFNNYSVGETIYVEIIGHRFEINDPVISVIAELAKSDRNKKRKLNIKASSEE